VFAKITSTHFGSTGQILAVRVCQVDAVPISFIFFNLLDILCGLAKNKLENAIHFFTLKPTVCK
jgi:hypothetical protein